jgi:hypothetical protein
MFIFITDQKLWWHELMSRSMSHGHSQTEMIYLSLFYHFMILFESDNVVILSFINFCLN